MSCGYRPDAISPDVIAKIKAAMVDGPKEVNNVQIERLNKRISELLSDNAALRKKLHTGYHFTAAELKAHDASVSKEARVAAKADILKNMNAEMQKQYEIQCQEFEQHTIEFWDECKKDFKKDDPEESFMAWCKTMWAVPIKVLVEDFRWKPITEDCCCDNRQALVKFCNKCVDLIDDIRQNQTKDIRTLCKEIADQYGASFVFEEEEDDHS